MFRKLSLREKLLSALVLASIAIVGGAMVDMANDNETPRALLGD